VLLKHLRYLCYVLRHKFYVWQYGRRLGVSWRRLLLHDLSKFRPSEWFAYVERFHGPQPPSPATLERFRAAWRLHATFNDHHPECWLGASGPMPEECVREMVADWCAAGVAQGKPDHLAWYGSWDGKDKLHPDARVLAERLLQEVIT
jgi:hypothetical protein